MHRSVAKVHNTVGLFLSLPPQFTLSVLGQVCRGEDVTCCSLVFPFHTILLLRSV